MLFVQVQYIYMCIYIYMCVYIVYRVKGVLSMIDGAREVGRTSSLELRKGGVAEETTK